MIFYKRTGKPATFTVTLSNVPGKAGYTQIIRVTLKANAFAQVDFEVPLE